MKIRFLKDFTSTTYGNVYVGREIEVKAKEGDRLIKYGYAEKVGKEDDGQSDKTGNDKTTSKGFPFIGK